MSVDVFTYFTNMYSESVKARFGEIDLNTRMVLEVGIPLFSVTALLGVSAWITNDAVLIIMDPGEDDDVDVIFMFAFAAGNAFVDVVCATLFYLRRGDVLKAQQGDGAGVTTRLLNDETKDESCSVSVATTATAASKAPSNTNLNMASALTHVGGDSLRTASVFFAATVASLTDYKASLCDAWAAIIVTVTILFIVGPLLREIGSAYTRLNEERRKLDEGDGIRNSTI